MVVLEVLVPVAFIGLVTWLAAGVRKARTESLTAAGGASFYANVLTIVSVTLALLGFAVAVKVILGFVNLGWSYGSVFQSGSPLSGSSSGSGICPAPVSGSGGCAPTSSADLTPLRTNDIVLAATLFGVGVVLFLVHRLLARAARRYPGGLPGWVHQGTVLGFAVLYAAGAIFGLIACVYGVISFLITPSTSLSSGIVFTAPFGEVAGAAAAFIPAWIVTFVLLWRRLRRPGPVPPPMGGVSSPPRS